MSSLVGFGGHTPREHKSQSNGYYLMAVDRRYVDLVNEGELGRNRFGPSSHPSCYLLKITPDARL